DDDVLKCRVFTILVFLLLGAIVNVAVAWAIGMWGQSSSVPYEFGIAEIHVPPKVQLVGGDMTVLGPSEFLIGWPARTLARPFWFWPDGSRVLWPGFAINTLFYAVILWLLFAA